MPIIIHYRDKCIGCSVCYELMPEIWRMSKKDGKATLVKSVIKKQTSVLSIDLASTPLAKKVAQSCPARIIKVVET